MKQSNIKDSFKQKGITLVSLVVTIIILLILAGVTLALISGSDGVLGRASHAVDENKKAMAKEQVELAIGDFQAAFFDEKYVERTSDGEKKEYISEKLMAGVETTDFYAKATADGTVNVYDLGKVESGKEVVIGAIEKDGSINWDGRQIADSGDSDLQEQVNELKKQVENLTTTVSLLQNSNIGKTKLIKRDWALASKTTQAGVTETLDTISLAGYGSGKAIISYSVSSHTNSTTKIHAIIAASTGEQSQDSGLTCLTCGGRSQSTASPSLNIEYSEDTTINFKINTETAFIPYYTYSILLIADEGK